MPNYLILATGGSTETLWGETTCNILVIDSCEGDNPQSAFDAWIADPDVSVYQGEYEDYCLIEIAAGTPLWGTDVVEPDSWPSREEDYGEEEEEDDVPDAGNGEK